MQSSPSKTLKDKLLPSVLWDALTKNLKAILMEVESLLTFCTTKEIDYGIWETNNILKLSLLLKYKKRFKKNNLKRLKLKIKKRKLKNRKKNLSQRNLMEILILEE